MNIIDSTKQEGLTVTTTPQKVWATNSGRVGIEISCPLANASSLLIKRVPAGTTPDPTVTDDTANVRLAAGQTFEGDNRYNANWDIWIAAETGSIKANCYEVQN